MFNKLCVIILAVISMNSLYGAPEVTTEDIDKELHGGGRLVYLQEKYEKTKINTQEHIQYYARNDANAVAQYTLMNLQGDVYSEFSKKAGKDLTNAKSQAHELYLLHQSFQGASTQGGTVPSLSLYEAIQKQQFAPAYFERVVQWFLDVERYMKSDTSGGLQGAATSATS